jgi:hypothetical protein
MGLPLSLRYFSCFLPLHPTPVRQLLPIVLFDLYYRLPDLFVLLAHPMNLDTFLSTTNFAPQLIRVFRPEEKAGQVVSVGEVHAGKFKKSFIELTVADGL